MTVHGSGDKRLTNEGNQTEGRLRDDDKGRFIA